MREAGPTRDRPSPNGSTRIPDPIVMGRADSTADLSRSPLHSTSGSPSLQEDERSALPMSKVRIHRSRPEREFMLIPNATVRDLKLSMAARGYLLEMLTNKPDWDPETAEKAAARAKRERGPGAESARRVTRILAELESRGYRHRVLRRGEGGSRVATEVHYYDMPAEPCEDARTCESCRRRGFSGSAELQTHADLGEQAVSAGGSESAEMPTQAELGEQGVFAGGSESAHGAGSTRRQSPEHDQKTVPVEPDAVISSGENTPTGDHAERESAISDHYLDDVTEELIDRLSADAVEARTITGMLESGSHPRAVENKILADRKPVRWEDQKTYSPWADQKTHTVWSPVGPPDELEARRAAKSAPRYGKCPYCQGGPFTLKRGALPKHGPRHDPCPGSFRLPMKEAIQ